TYGLLFGATLEHRDAVAEQGVEAASVLVGASRIELLVPSGDATTRARLAARAAATPSAGRPLPRQARAGHAPRRLRGRRRPIGPCRPPARGRRADRPGSATRGGRARGPLALCA